MSVIEEGTESQGHGQGQGGVLNQGYVHEEPKRKVSVSRDTQQSEQERQRKISSCSNGKFRKGPAHDKYHVAADHGNSPYLKHLNTLHDHAAKVNTSWWYVLCTRCRQKETGPGWEPTYWQSVCPYPFCPTYRHMARTLCLVFIILLAWGVVYTIMGEDVAPGGQLFDIIFLALCAHFGGYIFRMCNLPPLVGMLAVGVLFQNVGLIHVQGPYMKFTSLLRKIALVIILTRAGLDLDPPAMKRLFYTILRIGLIPWCVETGITLIFCYFFLDLPFMWALLTGSIVAAVSPAVIVPGLMRLRTKGYGVAKGIPTVVIAISGIDDAASVAAFGIIQSLMFSTHSMAYNIFLGPGSVIIGVGFGCLWGLISKYIPEKGDPFVVPMRILMLMGGGLIAVFGSEHVGLEGAGPLGVVAAAFVSAWLWSTLGWDIEHNPAATAFEIFWMVFEPILFSLTGTQIRIAEIDPHLFYIIVAGLLTAFIIRILVTLVVCLRASLNMREKLFMSFACMAKASVQAALAPVAIDTVANLGWGNKPEAHYAQLVCLVCILSIVLSAPTGAIIIYFSGPRLLTKTVPSKPQSGLRKSRPSLRDITVIDEGNEADDIERRASFSVRHSLTPSPRTSGTNL